jgi:putative DNA primase/helicase
MSRRKKPPAVLEDAARAVLPEVAPAAPEVAPEVAPEDEAAAPEDEARADDEAAAELEGEGGEVVSLDRYRRPEDAAAAREAAARADAEREAALAAMMVEWGIDRWRAERALGLMAEGCPERIAVLPRVRQPSKKSPGWAAMTTPDNARAVFELRPWRERLRWDAFALRAELRAARPGGPWAPWEDSDTADVRADLSADLSAVWAVEDVRAYAHGAARLTEWHPVRAYLRGLRWDGAPRLGSWLARFYGCPDTPLFAEMGARWLISAVARVMRPGCKADCVLTLAGLQGANKSLSLRVLAGDAWFADSPLPIGEKDGAQNLRGKWVWELAELSSVQGRTFEAVKAYLSSAEDTYRPSYGRETVTVPRQTVFCATVNPETGRRFLSDRTGNRRFWLVQVARTPADPVDVAALEAERDQLWAEALAMFDAGERWWLSAEHEAELAGVQEDAQGEIDAWAPLVADWLHRPDAPGWFTLAAAARAAVGLEEARLSKKDAERVADCLKHAGARPNTVRRVEGRNVKGWAWTPPGGAE